MSITNSDFARGYSTAIDGPDASSTKETTDGLPGVTLLKWFADAYRAQQVWRDKTVEALRMMNNDQWPAEILTQMPPNMAPIVINLMLMPLLYLSGVQRETREEAKVVSTTGGNPRLAELMNELVHWSESHNVGEEIDSQVFLDKIVTGLGWWKVAMEYDCDDLEGEIDVIRRHPLAVFPDPNFFDSRWSHAQFVFDSEFLTIEDAATKWPDHAEEFKTQTGEWLRTAYGTHGSTGIAGAGEYAGDSFALERMFWDSETKRVRIAECWYKKTTEREIAVNLQQPDQPIMDEDQVAQLKDAMQQDPQLAQEWLLFKKPMTSVRVAHLFHDKKLDDNPTPFEENPATFPIFPAIGFYFWKEPFGLVEIMKDLQREKNKRRSKLIELVGRMPLSGFMNKESEGADQKQIEEYGAGNGVVINYKTVEPTPIRPPDLPMALVGLEEAASKEMKEVTNIHDELLGQATQKTISGAAIEARQRGGFISHKMLFDTFRLEKQQRIQFLINAIKQHISPTKALRILGTVATNGGNQQMDQMLGQAAQNPMAAQDLMTLLSDAFEAEYDVVISSKPIEPSLAMDAWNTLSDLKQKGAEIPPKVLWEAAQKAGILSEGQVQEILAFISQQQQPMPGPGGPQGMPGPGGMPMPQGMPSPGGPPPGPPPARGVKGPARLPDLKG